jgi:hypothetical protein
MEFTKNKQKHPFLPTYLPTIHFYLPTIHFYLPTIHFYLPTPDNCCSEGRDSGVSPFTTAAAAFSPAAADSAEVEDSAAADSPEKEEAPSCVENEAVAAAFWVEKEAEWGSWHDESNRVRNGGILDKCFRTRPVWQRVSTDSLKFYSGQPCLPSTRLRAGHP